MTPEERQKVEAAKTLAAAAWHALDDLLSKEQADRDREVHQLEYGLFRQRARRADHRQPPLPQEFGGGPR